ncbi:hypothetical protein J4212_02055 [Candidatus Woesearchaeota archaeon]|nr:hypothetical protein [Candidatus Woesearchaeota archaeon]
MKCVICHKKLNKKDYAVGIRNLTFLSTIATYGTYLDYLFLLIFGKLDKYLDKHLLYWHKSCYTINKSKNKRVLEETDLIFDSNPNIGNWKEHLAAPLILAFIFLFGLPILAICSNKVLPTQSCFVNISEYVWFFRGISIFVILFFLLPVTPMLFIHRHIKKKISL